VNFRVVIIKTVHVLVLWWVIFCIGWLAYAAVARDFGTMTVVALASTVVEGAIVAANKGQCPLRALAEKYGAKDGSVTGIFLPKPLARNAFRFAFPFLGLELVVLATRLIFSV
jgi:hypothetical protein